MRPLDPQVAAQVGAWLATYLAHGVALFVAAWLGARVARSARVREQLWRAALFGPLVTASLQLGAGIAPLGGQWGIALEREALAASALGIAHEHVAHTHDAAVAPANLVLFVDAHGDVVDAPHDLAFGVPADVAFVGTPAAPEPAPERPLSLAATVLLATGIAALMIRALLEALRVQRLGRGVRLTRGPIVRAAESFARRAGLLRRVRIEVTERGSSPYATGVLRPRIVVPERAMAELDDAAIRAMVAHELGHIVRFDPLWTAAVRSVSALFFFQPLNWVIARRLDECAELCCDEFAVEVTGDEIALARCLASVADWIVGSSGARPACAMAHRGSPLRHRVERILATGGHVRRRHVGARLAGVAAVCATTLAVPGFAITQRPAAPHAEVTADVFVGAPVPASSPASAPASAPAPALASGRRPAPMGALRDLQTHVGELEAALQELDLELAEVVALTAQRRVSEATAAELGAMRARASRLRSLIGSVDALVERRSVRSLAPPPAPAPFQGRTR